MDTKGLQKEFISWCKANKKSPKSEQETKLLFVSFMKEKHPEEYKAAVENLKKLQLQKAQKAAHGAKLNYFKFLKNQCAEDEEVVYYKKGGLVSCGCKKKEDGGQVKKDCGGSTIAKFKALRMQSGGKKTISSNSNTTGSQEELKKVQEKTKKEDKKKSFEAKWKKKQVVVGRDLQKGNNNVTKEERQDVTKDACGSKMKKHLKGGKIIFSL